MLELQDYLPTLYALASAGALLIGLLLIADFAAIRAGHTAGTPIPPDFSRFYFRAARAHANMNESIAAFFCFAVTGVASAAAPFWLNLFAWIYIAGRVAHMLAYYANFKAPRSAAFGISMAALAGMFVCIALAWLS